WRRGPCSRRSTSNRRNWTRTFRPDTASGWSGCCASAASWWPRSRSSGDWTRSSGRPTGHRSSAGWRWWRWCWGRRGWRGTCCSGGARRTDAAEAPSRPGTGFAHTKNLVASRPDEKGWPMRSSLAWVVLLLSCGAAGAKDLVFVGTWVTTNRPLDGTLTCVVTDLGDNRWRGHFSGAWQGREFSYRVDFSGPPERLRGRATIDGAA